MREIKFRGVRVDNGEWHYGFYREFTLSDYWKDKAYRDGVNYYIDKKGMNESHLVIPETVGQYTGLKDKNGKEIYEGDIVKLTVSHYEDCSRKKLIGKEKQIGVVAFDYCSFGIKDNPKDTCLQLFSWILGLEHEIEVIGDIYRNPKLMEVEKC